MRSIQSKAHCTKSANTAAGKAPASMVALSLTASPATMAAFIGAGGLGERSVAGLAVNDSATMLAGALPAAVLALLVQWAFDWIERKFSPGGASRNA